MIMMMLFESRQSDFVRSTEIEWKAKDKKKKSACFWLCSYSHPIPESFPQFMASFIWLCVRSDAKKKQVSSDIEFDASLQFPCNGKDNVVVVGRKRGKSHCGNVVHNVPDNGCELCCFWNYVTMLWMFLMTIFLLFLCLQIFHVKNNLWKK